MKKGSKGGSGLCGDVSLKSFDECKRPDWGISNLTEPSCI